MSPAGAGPAGGQPLGSGPAVVALGGGHGLAASLAALRRITDRLTAVVTVADDGGSSGRLRVELGALPPGDLRMALTVLAAEDGDNDIRARLLQHRFGGTGPLAGHAVGNLLLVGLCEVLGDPVAALDTAARMLDAAGRVLPMSPHAVDMVAEVAGLVDSDPDATRLVHGQHAVAVTPGRVVGIRTVPARPAACAEAVAAVEAADWVVLGPGSWFTSVLPHLLVPGLAAALRRTTARRLLVVNLAPEAGETAGFSPEGHLEAIERHACGMRFDVVLCDRGTVSRPEGLQAAADALGARVELADVAREDGSARHDPTRLAAAYREVFADSTAGGPAGQTTSSREASSWR